MSIPPSHKKKTYFQTLQAFSVMFLTGSKFQHLCHIMFLAQQAGKLDRQGQNPQPQDCPKIQRSYESNEKWQFLTEVCYSKHWEAGNAEDKKM
jgi:hypothetical protein